MIVKILLQRSLHCICDTINVGSGSRSLPILENLGMKSPDHEIYLIS